MEKTYRTDSVVPRERRRSKFKIRPPPPPKKSDIESSQFSNIFEENSYFSSQTSISQIKSWKISKKRSQKLKPRSVVVPRQVIDRTKHQFYLKLDDMAQKGNFHFIQIKNCSELFLNSFQIYHF